MKKEKRPKKLNILPLVLLAVCCIGGAELIACRQFAPEQYQRITAPVRSAVHGAADLCQRLYLGAAGAASSAADHAARFWADLTAPREEEAPPVQLDSGSQEAAEPVAESKLPIADPLDAELRQRDGLDILTGGMAEVIYFNQGDEMWADQPYGSDTIGPYGCGPVAMAMVVASLTDTETDPAAMAQWAVDHGYWARKGGSWLSIVEGTAEGFGLTARSCDARTPEDLVDQLYSGNILVALMGPGHFTQKGHFIIIRGVTLTGELLVADPNSLERSLATWDPQLVLDELSASTSDGAPLWTVAIP